MKNYCCTSTIESSKTIYFTSFRSKATVAELKFKILKLLTKAMDYIYMVKVIL